MLDNLMFLARRELLVVMSLPYEELDDLQRDQSEFGVCQHGVYCGVVPPVTLLSLANNRPNPATIRASA